MIDSFKIVDQRYPEGVTHVFKITDDNKELIKPNNKFEGFKKGEVRIIDNGDVLYRGKTWIRLSNNMNMKSDNDFDRMFSFAKVREGQEVFSLKNKFLFGEKEGV